MSAPRVVLGFHSHGSCPTNFAMDLSKCLRYSGTMIPLCLHEQSCYVDSARNRIVRNFLSLPPQDATHLLMLDVDISFQPDAVLRTLQILENLQLDVLFGNYVLGNSGNSIFGAPENASREAAVLVGLQPNTTYMDVWTGGTGWVMMKRSLLERMQKESPGPWHWFPRDPTADGTDLRGEDISFGLRLYGLDPKPKVAGTTAILLRHLKTQPFVPEFMGQAAVTAGLSTLAFPNPYESDPSKYVVNGHHVVDVSKLTKEQADQIRAEIAAKKEKKDVKPNAEPAVLQPVPDPGDVLGPVPPEGDQPSGSVSPN